MCSFPNQFSSYNTLVDFFLSSCLLCSSFPVQSVGFKACTVKTPGSSSEDTYADQKHPQVQESLGQRLFLCLSVLPKHISALYWSMTLLNAITLNSNSLVMNSVGKLSNKYLLLFSFSVLSPYTQSGKKSQCLSVPRWNPLATVVQLFSGSESLSWPSKLTLEPGLRVLNILSGALLRRDHVWFIALFSTLSSIARVFPCCLQWISAAAFGCPTDRAVPAHSVLWVGRAEGRVFEQSSTENTASISQAPVKGLTGWWGRKKQEIKKKNPCSRCLWIGVCHKRGARDMESELFSLEKASKTKPNF